jgi:fructose-specific phosphotransferase system component IIB
MLYSKDIEKIKKLIIEKDTNQQFESFAFKILLQQLRTRYSLKNDEETLSEATKKVEEFFEKMKSLDTVKRDFKKICGRELNV